MAQASLGSVNMFEPPPPLAVAVFLTNMVGDSALDGSLFVAAHIVCWGLGSVLVLGVVQCVLSNLQSFHQGIERRLLYVTCACVRVSVCLSVPHGVMG